MAAVAQGVAVDQTTPGKYEHADDAPVVVWLLPVVESAVCGFGLACHAEKLRDLCALSWCALATNRQQRARRLHEPEQYAARMKKLCTKVIP